MSKYGEWLHRISKENPKEVVDFAAEKEKREVIPNERQSELNIKRREAIEQLPGFRDTVHSKNAIRSYSQLKPGEIFWVTNDNKAYLVAEVDGAGSKKKVTIKALDETATISTGITIYEMNKRLVSKEPLFNLDDNEAVNALMIRLWKWFCEDTEDEFYCLYGRDLHYITLFQILTRLRCNDRNCQWQGDKKMEPATNEWEFIMEALKPVGDLISMDFNTSDYEKSIEIWVRTRDSAAELLYLFPYDRGVIKV